ncbi:MAG: Exopolyphosphatase 2 [Candidatus Marinimicrobia bacterium]|nr:Exopolyphosphatase 2 [Candidatus Neomarinimicrobiota bacterium]
MNNTNQKYASIDIGTNSTLLLTAEYRDGRFHPIRNEVEITRLGQDVGKTGQLHPDAVECTFNTLKKYRQICDECGVKETVIGGTSAMRDASNGDEFIQRVQRELDWDIRILTGDDEARLTFLATRKEFADLNGDLLVVDIGGGSTEFIFGDIGGFEFARSLDIGTVRFTESMIKNDPPDEAELQEASDAIRKQLATELSDLEISAKETTLIGVAGTVTTLLAVEKEMETYIPEQIHKQHLTLRQIEHLLEKFCSMPLKQRKRLPGLQPKRADVIIMGTLIQKEIMDYFGFDRLLVNDRGVRYGLLYEAKLP